MVHTKDLLLSTTGIVVVMVGGCHTSLDRVVARECDVGQPERIRKHHHPPIDLPIDGIRIYGPPKEERVSFD